MKATVYCVTVLPIFLPSAVLDGKITEIKGVEVKSRNCNKLTYEQGVYREVFREAGLPFEVVIAD